MKRKKSKYRFWTKRQERDLFSNVSIVGVEWFRKHVNRTPKAVYNKLARDYGEGGLTRGAYPLSRLARITGYSICQLRRSQNALSQKWKRLGPKGAFLITEEQMEELVAWLAHDYWQKPKRRYGCCWCTSESLRPEANGLCVRCYHKHYRLCKRLGLPTTQKGQIQLLKKVRCLERDNSGEFDRFIADGLNTLENGIALEIEQIQRLATL